MVTFEGISVAEAYARESGLKWPILVDESLALYSAYGMGHGGRWDIWGPASWGLYIRLLLRGRKLQMPTGDVHQLGGDVLIDPAGIVRLHHVGRTPADRPTIESILDRIRD